MVTSLSVVLPLVLAGVLIASGIGKLRVPDDVAGWAELGVPRALRRPWIARMHPWGELALGVAVAVFGGVLGLVAALVAVALMAAYTWLVVRALRRSEDASCACFGARKRVTRVTVARNIWLTVLAVATAVVVSAGPLIGGALVAGWVWLPALAVVAITTALILWPEGAADSGAPAVAPAVAGATDEDELDYIRTRTPAVPVTLADGTVSDLRGLTRHRPMLLLMVSQTCGWCEPILELRTMWRDLLPEVDVRVLLNDPPESSGAWIETAEPQSLHDPEGYVAASFADIVPRPAAILFGADGLLAGGPVSGPDIEPFIGDIYENLHGERPKLPVIDRR